tara:strand:+ start:57 stop:707 length:651 start_codon:yes stop_codon:yes gene_type:complete
MAAPDRSRTAGRGTSSSAKTRLKKKAEEERKARQRREARLQIGRTRQARSGRGGPNRSGKPVSTERQGPVNLSDPSYRRGNRPSESRLEQERRRRAGQSFNPNDKARKPSVEPGSNPLQRAAKEQERKEKAAAARARAAAKAAASKDSSKTKPKPKPAAKRAATPSRPNPRMTGEGAPRPAAANSSSTAKKVSRLAKALADKKGMKSYMKRLREKK